MFYDKIYTKKNYSKEVKFIDAVIKRNGVKGKDVLDVACGTGTHAKLLSRMGYVVTGIDKNKEMLKIARKKTGSSKFFVGDMRTFNLGRKFDVILCMFTAINYNLTAADLIKTLRNFKRHLKKGGVVIFDAPFFYTAPTPNARFLDNKTAVLYAPTVEKGLNEITIH